MRVGILTFDDTTNYGAALQAYALNKKISDMGFQCETIRYQCENIHKREAPKKFSEVQGLKGKLAWLLTVRGAKRKHDYIQSFLNENAYMSSAIYDRSTIADSVQKYDRFVVGSDIIWETNVTGHDYTYFLDFLSESEKKISYSASFGYDDVPENEKEKVGELLSSFRALAVREEQGQNIITSILPEQNTMLTCDPTLLLTCEEWMEHVAANSKYEKDSYVFVYFTDKQGHLLKAAKEYAKKKKKKVVLYNAAVRKVRGVENVRNVAVGDFLSLIYNSNMVFTGSYHGVCFSVLFKKPFAFLNRAHASRILTLAHILGFERQNLEIVPDINDRLDYTLIDSRLKIFRDKSIQYLQNSLIG